MNSNLESQTRQRFLRSFPAAGLLLVSMVATAPPEAAAQLCTGNPCVISGARHLAAGEVVDLGDTVELEISSNAEITIDGVGDAAAEIRAGSIRVAGGARFVVESASSREYTVRAGPDHDLLLSARGDVEIGTAGGAAVVGTGDTAPRVRFSSDGTLRVAGPVDFSGNETDGGDLWLAAAGDLLISGSLDLSGAGDAAGGSLDLESDGSVAINAAITMESQKSDAGYLTIVAQSDVDLAGTLLLSSGSGGGGDAGSLEIHARAGDIRLLGTIIGQPGREPDDCGSVVSIDLVASASRENCSLRRAAGGGDIEIGGLIDIHGAGNDSCDGGQLRACASGSILQRPDSSFDATARAASAGELELFAPGGIVLHDADLTAASGSGGSANLKSTAGSVLLNGDLDTSGRAGLVDFGGRIDIEACHVNVQSGASLLARGGLSRPEWFAVVALDAGDGITISGSVIADDKVYLTTGGPVPAVTGSVSPDPIILTDTSLPTCGGDTNACGDSVLDEGEICDDGNSVDCDGCRGDCASLDAICGDGLQECGEQCDDGNGIDGDACTATCTLPEGEVLRLPGPHRRTGCLAAWQFRGAGLHSDGGRGLAADQQFCTDGDPGCDADLAIDGQCTLSTALCLGAADVERPHCPASDVARIKLKNPRFPQRSRPVLPNAVAIANALAATGVRLVSGAQILHAGGVVPAGTCTEEFPLVVAVGVRERFNLSARSADGVSMTRNRFDLTCMRNSAVCGDGHLDTGEECDDGNTATCDGCSATCRVEACGNGVVECGEECEPGLVASDRCTESCRISPPSIRIPGGRTAKECLLSWAFEQSPSQLALNRGGVPRYRQSCRDGDSECDFDPRHGVCGLRLWACAGEADPRISCASELVASVSAVGRTGDASRYTLSKALAGIVTPTPPGGSCSQMIEIKATTNGRPIRLRAKARGTARFDTDRLQIRCE